MSTAKESKKAKRPTSGEIEAALYRAIDATGERGLSLAEMLSVTRGLGVGQLKAGERDPALDALLAEGRLTRSVEPSPHGKPATIYRSVAAIEREAWFRAEVKRRGLDRPRSIRLAGACR